MSTCMIKNGFPKQCCSETILAEKWSFPHEVNFKKNSIRPLSTRIKRKYRLKPSSPNKKYQTSPNSVLRFYTTTNAIPSTSVLIFETSIKTEVKTSQLPVTRKSLKFFLKKSSVYFFTSKFLGWVEKKVKSFLCFSLFFLTHVIRNR